MKNPTNTHLFDQLGANIAYFLENKEKLESKELKIHLDEIKKNITDIIKDELIQNLLKTEKMDIVYIDNKDVKIEMDNKSKILKELKHNPEGLKTKIISQAMHGKITTTVDALETILKKKIEEEKFYTEVMNMSSYQEILQIFEIRCMKLEDRILSFEPGSATIDFNRIGCLLYHLVLKLGNSKPKIYGNATELYIYDKQLNETFILSNATGYKTYIASGEKDIYDLAELSQEKITEYGFSVVEFIDAEQRKRDVGKIIEERKKHKGTTTEQIETLLELGEELSPKADKNSELNLKKNPEIQKKIQDTFLELYPTDDTGFKYETLVQKVMEIHTIKLPKNFSSLNSCFGKTPYIFNKEYTLAILRDNKEAIGKIEEEMREKRYIDAQSEENQIVKNVLKEYFVIKENPQKKEEFIKKYPKILKNMNNTAQRLGGLPIGKEGYLENLVNDGNVYERFLNFERDYVKSLAMRKYSKEVADAAKEYTGSPDGFIAYMERKSKGGVGDGKDFNSGNNEGIRTAQHERKLGISLEKEEVIALAKEIFGEKDGKIRITERVYKEYFKNHPDQQKILPKQIYALNNCFVKVDPYAHDMIHSLEYLEALLNNDLAQARKEREKYMQKKLKESEEEDVQRMLLYIWKHIHAQNGQDMTGSAWAVFASQENIQCMLAKNSTLKMMRKQISSIASYCIMDVNANFNAMNWCSLKDILKPKIQEISNRNPVLYNEKFVVIQ